MSKQHLCKIRDYRDVWIKHYLYTLRPLLACRYVLNTGEQPPMLFKELVTSSSLEQSVISEISKLIMIKQSSEEQHTVPHVQALDKFISTEYVKLREALPPIPVKHPVEPFNETLRTMLTHFAPSG